MYVPSPPSPFSNFPATIDGGRSYHAFLCKLGLLACITITSSAGTGPVQPSFVVGLFGRSRYRKCGVLLPCACTTFQKLAIHVCHCVNSSAYMCRTSQAQVCQKHPAFVASLGACTSDLQHEICIGTSLSSIVNSRDYWKFASIHYYASRQAARPFQ